MARSVLIDLTRSQTRSDQISAAGGEEAQVHADLGPTDLAFIRDLGDRGYEFEECVFVVLDAFREQHRPCLIDHDAMMSSFARVDSYPERRLIQCPLISCNSVGLVDNYAGTSLPNDQ